MQGRLRCRAGDAASRTSRGLQRTINARTQLLSGSVDPPMGRPRALPDSPGKPLRAARVSLCLPSSPAQAFEKTAPSGTSPVVAQRHGATRSLRARATIARFRERPSRALTQFPYRRESALPGW